MTKLVETKPSSFEEAVEKLIWVDAMVEQYDFIVKNNVWEVVPRLADKLIVGLRWIFKMGWKIHQMDVKIAFLNGVIEEECTSRNWKDRWPSHQVGFTKSEADENLYHILVEGKLLIIVLYVDDLILMGDEKLIRSCKKDLAREFEMRDMGLMHYFLRLEVWKGNGELFVSQGEYANEILKKFRMESSKFLETPPATNWRKEDATSGEEVEATIYQQLVGSLMYLVNTRPNMCYAINQLIQYMVKLTKLFWKVAKCVLQYLRGTTQFGLWYKQTEGVKLRGFTDVDWVGSPSDWKSTSGEIFSVGCIVVS
eukprot:PITA_09243